MNLQKVYNFTNKQTISKGHDLFPEFNHNILKMYAKRWAAKYNVLNIERIVLCRYNVNEHQAHLTINLGGGVIPNKYVLIFIFSGGQDIDLSMIENYSTQNDSKCLHALKDIKFANQFASQGVHRLFDKAFPSVVYKSNIDNEYYREWSTELTKDGKMNDVQNTYPDESIVLWKRKV